MIFTARTSTDVLQFLPLNTWTEIVLLDSKHTNNGVYIATTEDKIIRRMNDMVTISEHVKSYQKIEKFMQNSLVVIHIDGEWFRGKLACFNEFLPNDTRIELIDIGCIYNTKLDNLYLLPYYLNYEPLALPIKFKDGYIPNTSKLSVKPLLSDSSLYDGLVVVEAKCDQEKQKFALKECINNNVNIDSTRIIANSFDNDLSSFLSSCYTKSKLMKPYIPLENGSVCLITFVEDFNSIYVCKAIKNDKGPTYSLCNYDILLKTNQSKDDIPKEYPTVGNIVKVFSLKYKNLLRAKLLKHNENGTFDVYFIDYGNTETVKSNVIYELDDKLQMPGLAIKVGINELNSCTFTEKIKKMFEDFIDSGKPFEIEFDEKSKHCLEKVKLKDMESGSYIDINYINRFLQETNSDNVLKEHYELSSKAAVSSLNENTELLEKDNTNQLNNLKNNDIVYLKNFESMDEVYVVNDAKLFNDSMVNIQNNPFVPKTDIDVGNIVMVSNVNSSCRGKVIEVNDTTINVQDIDFGCFHTVEAKNIGELPINLRKEFDESSSNRYQEITLKRKDNSENIFEEFLKTKPAVGNGLSNKCLSEETKKPTEESSNNSFKSISLKNGDYCMLSHFEDFQNIYVCKAVCSKEDPNVYEMHNFDIIMKTINCNERKIKTNLAIGDIIKVFLIQFKHFLRAQITNIENDKIHIFCIDFGIVETVHSSDIYELPDHLKIITDIPLRVSIDVPPNAVINDAIRNLFTTILDIGVTYFIEYNNKSSNCLENVILREVNSGNCLNKEVLKLLLSEKKHLKNCDTCVLTYFENFDSIYVFKHESENIKMLQDIIASTDCIPVRNLVIGDTVKVLSPSFEDLFRAKIVNIKDNGDCYVFYSDYGNTEVVSPSNIFQLSDNLKKKPDLAIKIGLNIPSSIKPNTKISDLFSGLANEAKPLSIEFDESSEFGLNNCVLKVISSGLNINNEIIKLSSNQSHVSSEKEKNIELKIEDSKSVVNIKTESASLKTGELIHFRHFLNFSSVFVSRISDYNNFLYLMNKISQGKAKNKLNIQVGDIVRVLYADIMHRAKVLKKKDESHYCVVYIDFGNEDTVTVDEIFELPDEFKKFPGCIKVGLKTPRKIDLTEEVSNYFESIDKEEPLRLEYDESSSNGLEEVSLKRKNSSDIIDEVYNIIKLNSTPIDFKDKSTEETQNIPTNYIVSASDIELKNGDTVFCCYFKDFNQIYICKACKNNTMPVNMNLIVDYSKSKDIVVKNKPKYGDIVRVKYEKYLVRAKVHDKSGLLYTVELLDIGRYLKVLIDNIYELPYDLKKIPKLVKHVGLGGTNQIKVNEMVENYFNGLWHNEPVPLILNFDNDNNGLNSVSLKRKNNGCNIIDDLLKICDTVNDGPLKTANFVLQNPKCFGTNDINFQVVSGDRVEFLNGTSVEHINVKHLKLYNEFNHVFEKLKNEKSENLKPIVPNINDVVLVSSSKFNGFLRAKVISPVTEDSSKFRCCFIDHGIFDNIPLKNIYALPNYIMINKVPALANRVALDGLTKNSVNITPFLTSLIGKEYVLEYEKNCNRWYKRVTLKDPKTNVSLNEELKHKVSNNSSVQQRLAKKIIMPEEIENVVQKQSQPIKNHSLVKIIHFEVNDSIYIRDASFKSIEDFNLFNMQMIKYYRIADKNNSTKELNNIMGDRNKLYCVFHVDYGNKEIVEAEDILELPEKFDKDHYQYFAIKIKLRNMPRLISEKECELVKDYFKNKFVVCNETVIIEFNECDPNGLNDSILKTEHYEKNIVEEVKILINAQLHEGIKITGQEYHNTEQISSQNHPMIPSSAWKFNNKSK
ncbi:Hypothetical protein CINCED_3A001375 [Cinara cedri]|uniref:Tudor domain-containing protein n=1 Tax=Cinara cedri TaxID=506608 RepID=A0A5E4N9X0_9HEMI|nr:Hypothetical protein CINCED_3A001375 [Cinara cedri]